MYFVSCQSLLPLSRFCFVLTFVFMLMISRPECSVAAAKMVEISPHEVSIIQLNEIIDRYPQVLKLEKLDQVPEADEWWEVNLRYGTIVRSLAKHYESSRPELALKLYDRFLEIMAMVQVAEHPRASSLHGLFTMSAVNVYADKAELYLALDLEAKALAAMRDRLALTDERYGPESDYAIRATMDLGHFYARIGRPEEAQATYQEALAKIEKAHGVDSHTFRSKLQQLERRHSP